MWEVVSTRKGAMLISVHQSRTWCGFFRVREVRLSFAEYTELQKVYGQAMASECKPAVVKSRLFEKVCRLWTKSNPEEIALRALMPYVFPLLGTEPSRSCCGDWSRSGASWATVEVERVNVDGSINPSPTITPAGTGGSGESGTAAIVPPTEPAAEEEKKDEVDAEEVPPALCNAGEDLGGIPPVPVPVASDDRDNHGVMAVPVSAGQVRAVQVMPSCGPPKVFANTKDNVDIAVAERIDKKQKVPVISKDMRQKIDRCVKAAMHGEKGVPAIFSKGNIGRWLDGIGFGDIKSKKWSPKRLADAIEDLARQYSPEFEFQSGIKAEPMAEGKPPRMIIADGDKGQVMALLVIACFEELLVGTFQAQTTKHVSKPEAIERLRSNLRFQKHLRSKGGSSIAVEGDGSAWDTTNTPPIRGLIEDRILRHITNVLMELTNIVPPEWGASHSAAGESATFQVRYPQGGFLELLAIRRSGHRGTSILNWWINKIMWICTLSSEPWCYLNPKRVEAKSVKGGQMSLKCCFEGDDSLLLMLGWTQAEIEERVVPVWSACGFNMKMVYGVNDGDICEFTGWKLVKENGGFGAAMPDLRRTIKNMGCSCSPLAVQGHRDDNVDVVKGVAAAKALAYASIYAATVPTFAKKCLDYANSLSCGARFTQDEQWKINGGEELIEADVRNAIEMRMKEGGGPEEERTYKSFNLEITEEERDSFQGYVWDFSELKDYSGFKESLPLKWRS